jgi:ABC-2 type transport system ATP-binding protein
MENLLEVKSLKKIYGRIAAVNDVSFSVKKGQVFGLLGPNGSGKTTLLGCITGILLPNGGSFDWFGGSDFDQARKRIGALIETPNFYPYLSAYKNLEIVAKIKDCSTERIDEVLKEVDLFERKNDSFKTYSLGMKQRLAIAAALLNNPEVLILDEPTNGLDPQGINEIRNIIRAQQQAGKTIILASHLLNEVEKVCTDVVILRKGQVLQHGHVSELLSGKSRIAVSSSNMEMLQSQLSKLSQVEQVSLRDGLVYAELRDNCVVSDINKALVESGIDVNHFVQVKSDLESEFLKLVQK